MLRVIGQDDPATVYAREAKLQNLAPLLCNKGELSAQLTAEIKKRNNLFSHHRGMLEDKALQRRVCCVWLRRIFLYLCTGGGRSGEPS